MSTELGLVHLCCRCGQVRGTVTNARPHNVNRVVCYCDDCQAFAHALSRPDILDARGGSDIIQVAPAMLTIGEGHRHVAAMRLSEKGLYRFYAACCGTPLGNTPGAAIPLIGVPRAAFEAVEQDLDTSFGSPIGVVHLDDAAGSTKHGSRGVPLSILIRTVLKIIGWRLRGRAWPHPYFDRTTKRSHFPVNILPSAHRESIRRRMMEKRERGKP
jgi:hypothetical protein